MAQFNPAFLPVSVTPEEIVAAARHYLGLRYSKNGTYVTETESGPRGFMDCAGLFLLVARRLGLLAPDFDPNLPPSATGIARETSLRQILLTNFTRVNLGEMAPGDIFVVKWETPHPASPQGEEENVWGRHLAVCAAMEPAPYGSLIHCINDQSGKGSVFEQRLDPFLWGYIWRVYRLNSLAGGGNG